MVSKTNHHPLSHPPFNTPSSPRYCETPSFAREVLKRSLHESARTCQTRIVKSRSRSPLEGGLPFHLSPPQTNISRDAKLRSRSCERFVARECSNRPSNSIVELRSESPSRSDTTTHCSVQLRRTSRWNERASSVTTKVTRTLDSRSRLRTDVPIATMLASEPIDCDDGRTTNHFDRDDDRKHDREEARE